MSPSRSAFSCMERQEPPNFNVSCAVTICCLYKLQVISWIQRNLVSLNLFFHPIIHPFFSTYLGLGRRAAAFPLPSFFIQLFRRGGSQGIPRPVDCPKCSGSSREPPPGETCPEVLTRDLSTYYIIVNISNICVIQMQRLRQTFTVSCMYALQCIEAISFCTGSE